MPLWLLESEAGYRGFVSASIERAVSRRLAEAREAATLDAWEKAAHTKRRPEVEAP